MDLTTVSRYTKLLYRIAMMRQFELEVAAKCASGEIHGEMHLGIGQEAVSAVLADFLQPGDAVLTTHRPHLHAIASGVDPVDMLAEIFERDGLNHGKGGHMHLFDAKHMFMCTGIVGASAPLALGYALAQKFRCDTGVTVAIMGDAATNQGAVFESLNLAAVLKLPVLFLVENNEYGISVPRTASTAGDIHHRGQSMGIPGVRCDGRDVDDLAEAFTTSFDVVRNDRRPALLVADVDRWRGHYEGDADFYRTNIQKTAAMAPDRDPLQRLGSKVEELGILTKTERSELEQKAIEQAQDWASEAASRPLPAVTTATQGVYTGV